MKAKWIVIAWMPLIAACGERKPTKAPASTSQDPTATDSKKPTGDKSSEAVFGKGPEEGTVPTSSNVQISDEILKACGITAPEARFAFDSSNVNEKELSGLEKLVGCFTTGALKGRTLKMVGRADARGTPEYNNVLGQARADAISGYLQKKGLPKAQASTTTRGASDATGSDEAGYAKDRRVDLVLDN